MKNDVYFIFEKTSMSLVWKVNELARIFSTNYIIIVKKYFETQQNIYIFRISSTRFIECQDLQNFFEFKKIRSFNIFIKNCKYILIFTIIKILC